MSRRIILAASSGLLLALAFPRWNLWPLAWVALVPLFRALENAHRSREAFFLGYAGGFIFYLLSISWLRHVTVFGLFFVAAVLSLYWGIFGIIFHQGNRGGRTPSFLLLPAVWVALEFIRSEVPIWGFGWNLLGYSQAPNLLIAQLASLGGVYGVSFLVLLGNAVVYSLFREGIKKQFQSLLVFGLLTAAVFFFGWSRLLTYQPRTPFRVSVLQGNIPQLLKWDEKYRQEILRIYLNLTELASYDKPQLIVWPEAAFPGFFNRDPEAEKIHALVQKIQVPVLIGSPRQEDHGYFNSAYLLDISGSTAERYDKLRLVPFGEYVPWKPVFGFLEPYAYSLGVSDFSPGREATVFQLGEEGPRFSVLICFEDIFTDLARKFVGKGAGFLVAITNDAWFGHSSAPYQHLQASVFRAIENGVSIVHAANTGVSGFITSRGVVADRVRNQEGKDTFMMGGLTSPVEAAAEETLYRKGGWLFPWICLGVSLLASWRILIYSAPNKLRKDKAPGKIEAANGH